MLRAGLYVDCTGFAGVLIGRALGEPWRDVTEILFVDRAVAMPVPYDRPDAPIVPATVSSAHETGWTWDIGLDSRRGIGYCYSSKYADDDRAEQVLRDYIGPTAEKLSARRLKMRIGFRDRQWVKNCVAVGLSAGFLEPLEATGIIQIEAAAHMIAEYFPRRGDMETVAKHFSHVMKRRYECAVDFIKMHYFLSKRIDNPFWIDNRKPQTATPALLLLHWPLAMLPYRLAEFLWFPMQWLLLLGTAWLWLRRFPKKRRRVRSRRETSTLHGTNEAQRRALGSAASSPLQRVAFPDALPAQRQIPRSRRPRRRIAATSNPADQTGRHPGRLLRRSWAGIDPKSSRG